MIERAPGTRIDIISLESAGVEPGNYLRGLGVSYDVMEGLYMSELYREQCLFLELTRTRRASRYRVPSAPSFRTRSIRMCSMTSTWS